MNNAFLIDFKFVYLDHFDYQHEIKVRHFMFDDDKKWYNEPFKTGRTKRNLKASLLCKCRSNDWRDNGRDTNEFECDQCGMFITVIGDLIE